MRTETPAILAPKCGRNALRDTLRIGELSNAGKPWRNSGNTFHGEPVEPGRRISTGQMPRDEVAELNAHIQRNAVDYAIYSYATVIAYRVKAQDGVGAFWVITDAGHSQTTRVQLGKLYTLTDPRCGYEGPTPV
jgi:hypothetical protein